MVYSIVVLMEVPAGLGRKSAGLTAEGSLSVRKVRKSALLVYTSTHDGQMVFASDILYIWALFWSKLAVCFLVKRLCIARRHVRLANVLTCTSAGLGLVSLFVVGIRERPAQPWVIAARSTVSTGYRSSLWFLDTDACHSSTDGPLSSRSLA